MTRIPGGVVSAMLCAAAVIAQVVGGKATRDALFLSSLDIATLPTMLMVTAGGSILVVLAHARAAQRWAPRTLVPALFAASGVLFLAEWLLRPAAPAATAVTLYLHVSIAGPLLTSGFWLMASEAFSPRTAKKGYGRIAAAGSLGGLAGALVAERVAAVSGVPSMLLVLGGFQLLTGWLVRRMTSGTPATLNTLASDSLQPADTAADSHGLPYGSLDQHAPATGRQDGLPVAMAVKAPLRSGARVIAESPHLRVLVGLLLLGTTSATLLDYVFKAGAAEAYGPGDRLLRFFAFYYAATSFAAFLLQTFASRAVLDRFGLGLTTSAPSIALLAGSLGGLVAPGFGSLIVARGGESIFRGSWFRAGYELFYTPIPPGEKRSAKSLIDVGVERAGDALGGAIVRLIITIGFASPGTVILGAAMVSSVGAVLAASRLNRWYVRTLEQSLVNQAAGIDLSLTADEATAKVLRRVHQDRVEGALTGAETVAVDMTAHVNPAFQDIRALHSGNRERIRRVLGRDECLKPGLVSHVIPLLGVDSLADYAIFALRKVAEERAGELTDALLDANQDSVVRRRLAQVFSVCVSQRAADCLLLALDDSRFAVRFQAARSLASMVEKNPRLRFDRERILEAVLRESVLARPVWESRRLLDPAATLTPLDGFVRDRASQSLTHVFTLLSLVLPREPIQIAFRSLRSGDRHLRGTALEYLESVLPPAVRARICPYLVDRPIETGPERTRLISELLRSSGSQTLQTAARPAGRSPIAGFPSH